MYQSKLINILLIPAALMAVLVSCTKTEEAEPVKPEPTEHTFKVSFETPTKTSFDGNRIDWSKFDGISVFDGTSNNLFITRDEGKATADFTGNAFEADSYAALFPYYSKATYKSGKIVTYLPPTQKSFDGTFGGMTNIAAGISAGGEITLQNVCGYVKFTLDSKMNEFTQATITAVAGENIAGNVTISWNGDIPSARASGSQQIMVIPSAESIESGVYYVIAAPSSFAEGLSFTFTRKKDGATYSKTFTDVSVERNRILDLGAIRPDDTWAQVSSVTTGTPTLKGGVMTISGNKVSLVDADPAFVTCGMSVSVDGGANWTDVFSAPMESTTFDWQASGYEFCKEYQFKAWARYKEDTPVCSEPVVVNAHVTKVTVGSLNLDGTTLSVKGSMFETEACDITDLFCGIELSADSGASWTEYGKAVPSSSSFDTQATIQTGVPYLVRAWVQAGSTAKVYSGNADMSPRISTVTTGTATLDGLNAKLSGNIISAQFCDLSAITCGIEYSRDGINWTNVSSAAATGWTFDAGTTVLQGRTYLRAWAQITGQDKVYGNSTYVATDKVDLNFDFSTQAIVEENITAVSSTDSSNPLTELPLKDRIITGEDSYIYKFADYGNVNFVVYSHWADGARTAMTYRIFSSKGLRCTTAGNSTGKYYFMSFPAINGYKLVSVENWCTQTGRKMNIADSPVQGGETILATTSGTSTLDETGFYISVMDISDKSAANTAYYAAFRSNGYNAKLICHYVKVE